MLQPEIGLLAKVLLLLIIASWLYWLVALFLVHDFFRDRPRARGDSQASSGVHPFTPPVSILKPVRGLDKQAYQNFVSFCRQDYPEFELLFGVADPRDLAIPLIERLQREFPQCRIHLSIAPSLGANQKASILHYLAAQASHEILVVSDSDMRVTPDYLRQVVAPLADEQVGLVTCPYRAGEALTFTARLEALHMGVTFLPSVMVARHFLTMRFAMGATIALRRDDLQQIGGFAAIADYLADDYHIALRISSLGLKVHLSHYIVVSILGTTTFLEEWLREVRWARTNRLNRPREYPGLLLTFSTPLSVALVVVSDYAPLGWRVLIASVLLRWVVGWIVTGHTGDHEARRWLIWLPVRDMLSAVIWCVGGVGRSVVWRGEALRVQPDGRLEPATPLPSEPMDEHQVRRA